MGFFAYPGKRGTHYAPNAELHVLARLDQDPIEALQALVEALDAPMAPVPEVERPGIVRGAPTRLSMVEIGGMVVYGVDAVIMPDGALSENLLGMSYLSRLRRFEMTGGRLVLEQ